MSRRTRTQPSRSPSPPSREILPSKAEPAAGSGPDSSKLHSPSSGIVSSRFASSGHHEKDRATSNPTSSSSSRPESRWAASFNSTIRPSGSITSTGSFIPLTTVAQATGVTSSSRYRSTAGRNPSPVTANVIAAVARCASHPEPETCRPCSRTREAARRRASPRPECDKSRPTGPPPGQARSSKPRPGRRNT